MSCAVAGLASRNGVMIDDMTPVRNELPWLYCPTCRARREGSTSMTLDFANFIGLFGSALMVVAYAYSNVTKPLT